MIICHSRRFIFFSAPKTGSESLRKLLAPYAEEPVHPWRYATRREPFYPHMPPRDALAVLSGRGIDTTDYRTITCIRDPFARLVSLYRMIREVDGVWKLRRRLGGQDIAFAAWLRRSRPDGHGGGGRVHQRWRRYGSWSAKTWCSDHKGRFLITDLLDTDRINEDMPGLMTRLCLPEAVDIPHVNARPPADHAAWYTAASRDLVTQRYAWDIAYLNRIRSR